MEKRRGLGLAIVVVIAMGAQMNAAAEDAATYFDGSSRKLGRGLLNMVTAPLELIREPYLTSQETGGPAGLSIGLVRGIGSAIARELAGIVEVTTFFVPIPRDFEPLIQPEFIYAHGDWAS